MPIHDGRGLEWSAKEYIFNERLFLWDDVGLSQSRKKRYQLIFDIAKLTEPLTADVPRDLRAAVESLEIEEPEVVLRILRRISLFVQIFGYDHFVEDVTQEGGQWGLASGLGSRDPVNVIPGGKPNVHHRIVIGLANGGKLQSVMRNIRKHMHQGVDRTKTALVITNTWVPNIFRNSVEDVHLLQRAGKKFIFVLVNGRRLVPMDFSFS